MRQLSLTVAALLCSGCAAAGIPSEPAAPTTPPPVTPSTSTQSGAATPVATPTVGIRALIEGQFSDAARVYREWWPQFVTPQLHVLGTDSIDGARSPCGPLRLGDAFYCSTDNGVYLDLGMLEDFSRLPRGDGATLATVAHELGHAWQAQRALVFTGPTVMDSELHADCLSGAVIAALDSDGVALAQGAADAYASGSYNWTNPQFHGTPAQRREATLRGGEGLAACNVLVR